MSTRIVIFVLALCFGDAPGASEYTTRAPIDAVQGYSLSITSHPGLCAEDAPKCISTRAPVYRWPVVDGDRIVVAGDSTPTSGTAVVRTRHLFVPVDVGATSSSRSVSIQVVLTPTPRLIINRADSQFTVAAVPGRWIEIPPEAGADDVFVRLDPPLAEAQ